MVVTLYEVTASTQNCKFCFEHVKIRAQKFMYYVIHVQLFALEMWCTYYTLKVIPMVAGY